MIALTMLLVAGVWIWFGAKVWRWITLRTKMHRTTRMALAVIFFTVWIVGPFLDELLGVREFERLCREMPLTKFYGPAAVGPGDFFDESGAQRWNTDEEFLTFKREGRQWNQKIGAREERVNLASWPMPIYENQTTDYAKSTNQPILETRYRKSLGGWLRRVSGWSNQSYYVCQSTGFIPRYQQMIKFVAEKP